MKATTIMFNCSPTTLLEIAIRTLIVYALLVVLVRMAGKREIAQLTPFDLVVLLLISNAVQNAMTGPDTSVTGGFVAATTLVIANFIVAKIRLKSSSFRRFVEGVPVVLVYQGKIVYENLQHEQMTVEELMAILREHEAPTAEEVEVATLETDGAVSVIRKKQGDGQRIIHTRRRLSRHARRPSE
jgi:uncharacterized membrane protein YcaP (DUF421 family)